MLSNTQGATIHYTLDELGDVSESDPVYDPENPPTLNAIEGGAPYILRARAFKNGVGSLQNQESYGLFQSVGQVSVPRIEPDGGLFNNPVEIQFFNETPGVQFDYTLDESDPRSSPTAIRQSRRNSAFGPAESFLFTLDQSGLMKVSSSRLGFENSPVAQVGFRFQAAAPTIESQEEATGTRTVTLQTITESAQIYYTLDGTTPTSGSALYEEPLQFSTIDQEIRIQALAIRSGFEPSPVSSRILESTESPELPEIIGYQVDFSGLEGDQLTISVDYTGEVSQAYWTLNGIPLAYAGVGLEILDSTQEQSGAYQLVLENKAGQILSDEIPVTVQPLPDLVIDSLEIQSDGTALIAWLTLPGWSYAVEASGNLEDWTQIHTGPIIGTGETITYPAPVSDLAPYQYYRLRANRLDPQLAPEAMGLVAIPGGTFQMNYLSPENPGSTVTVSSFYMEPTEITYERWVEVRDWAEANGYSFDRQGEAGARLDAEFPEGHPVTTVNWFDGVKWANARSEMLGLQPVYYTNADQDEVYREGRIHLLNTFVAWGANGFRLPTEAEWEYASRGGLENQIYPNGNSITPDDANFDFDVIGRTPVNATTVVGSYPVNGYGLYDMAGNVREWVWNNSGVFDPEGTTDPRGPEELPGFVQRILRGGAYNDGETQLQNRTRETAPPTGAGDITGFRLVRQY